MFASIQNPREAIITGMPTGIICSSASRAWLGGEAVSFLESHTMRWGKKRSRRRRLQAGNHPCGSVCYLPYVCTAVYRTASKNKFIYTDVEANKLFVLLGSAPTHNLGEPLIPRREEEQSTHIIPSSCTRRARSQRGLAVCVSSPALFLLLLPRTYL